MDVVQLDGGVRIVFDKSNKGDTEKVFPIIYASILKSFDSEVRDILLSWFNIQMLFTKLAEADGDTELFMRIMKDTNEKMLASRPLMVTAGVIKGVIDMAENIVEVEILDDGDVSYYPSRKA